MSKVDYDKAKRRDSVRDGGYDDDPRGGGAAWGSKPATKKQTVEMAALAAEIGEALPTGNVTRNVAKRWLAKARVKATMARAAK